MARRSRVPKTPRAPDIHSDNVQHDEGMNEGAVELTSERDVAPAQQDAVLHLGSSLPDVPPESWNKSFSSPLRRDATSAANMGNEHSRETNAALHRTTDKLLTGENVSPRKSTGRLRSVSNRQPNPAYRNPVSNQQRLPAQPSVRKSVYDPEDSPENVRPDRRHTVQQLPFSPTKREKRAAATRERAQDVPATEAAQDAVSTRKSRRQQGLPEEIPETSLSPTSARTTAANVEDEQGGQASSPNDKFRSWFGEYLNQPEQETAAVAGTGDVMGEDIVVARHADVPAGAGARIQPEETPSRPKGRPKKAPTEKSPKPKKGPGRSPKKSRDTTGVEHPRKSRPSRKSAVEDLQKRTAEGADEDREQRAPSSDGSDYVAEDDDVDELTQKQPRVTSQSKGARAGAGEQQTSQAGSRKRQLDRSSSARANMARKRARVAGEEQDGQVEEDAGEDEGVQDGAADGNAAESRLFGQFSRLRDILENLDDVGRNVIGGEKKERRKIELTDKDVKKTVKLCEKARKRFSTLHRQSGKFDLETDPASVLGDIAERVDGLRGRSDEYPTDFKNKEKCKGIYAHLIPKLVELVWDAVTCYLDMDKDEVPAGQIKIGHLRIVNQIIDLSLQLEVAAQKYERPDSNLKIIRPVHNGIAVPLRDVRETFRKIVRDHEYGIQETRRNQIAATQRALDLEREERELKQREEDRKLDLKWKGLHDERSWAEGGIPTARKLEHLQISSNLPIEYDQNGRAFSREEAFGPRIGPTPDKVDEAAALEWSMDELTALLDGLKQYSGPRVFERIFRRYCGVRKELNRFNVTEIVVTAAILRERLVSSQERDEERGGVVEDWIVATPVWIKGHKALGKENEDAPVDLTTEA